MARVYASLSAVADKSKIGSSLEIALKSGIDGVHFDILDGSMIGSKTPYTPDYFAKVANFCRTRSDKSDFALEAHIISKEPGLLIDSYIKAGANRISVPYEAYEANTKELLDLLRSLKGQAKAGVSFYVNEMSKPLDFNIMMTANYILLAGSKTVTDTAPMMPAALGHVQNISSMKKRYNPSLELVVGGGVTEGNVKGLKDAGSDILVLGNFLWSSEKQVEFIKKVKGY